jgi:pSer/pThr/pTyr-binding forkhead associated (FHA) protein
LEVNFIVAQPIGKSKKFKLCLGEYLVIGRSTRAAQVAIRDDLASNSHCRVSLENNQIQIEDLNSKNGVYLNGVRIIKQRMFLSDKVKVGESILFINQDKLDSLTREKLTYTGTHIRKNGGFTLELDSALVDSMNQSTKESSLTKDAVHDRKKAYAKQRVSHEKIMSRSKLRFFEQCALMIDLCISVMVFFLGLGLYYIINASKIPELEEQYESYQIIFSDEMSGYTLGALLVAIAFFAITRGIKSGSLGERFLKIN